ncbi:hypothetical protein ACFSSF_05610 [Dietzia aerolata]|uniref:hypothetical protein n=1 Tax=Dietzia aerolata TaxID=595984 RepID=UPI003642F345
MSTPTASTLTPDLGAPRARLIAGDLGTVDAADLVAVIDSVAARASALDRADADLREDISALAGLGLFDVDRTPVAVAATIIEAVATESLAVAFGAWAQRMTAAYLRHAADRSDAAMRTYRAVADGKRPGVTGMAAAQRQAVGLGDVPITATRVDGGYRIDGPIAWASNVYPDSTIVLAANTEDGRSLVLTFEASASGVEIRNAPDLLALNATASTMIGLDGVVVPDEQVLGRTSPTSCRVCARSSSFSRRHSAPGWAHARSPRQRGGWKDSGRSIRTSTRRSRDGMSTCTPNSTDSPRFRTRQP